MTARHTHSPFRQLRLLCLLPALLTSTAIHAQPKADVDNDVVATGDIMYQQPHTATFTLRNSGTEPLRILSVEAACGCTAVSWSKEPVAPGTATEIAVTYDAQLLGTFQKEVELRTNASEEPVYLTLQGRVVTTVSDYSDAFPYDLGSVRLTARQIDFGDITIGERAEVEIAVLNDSRNAYHPALMHLPPYLTATYHPETLAGGRSGRITLRLNSERMKHYGLNTTTIYLARRQGDTVGHDNEIAVSSVLLPSFAHLSEAERAAAPVLALDADSLYFGPIGKKRTATRSVSIANNGQRPLTIQSVQVTGSGLDVRLTNRTVQPGKQVRLKVTLHADAYRAAAVPPAILIITNDPAHTKTLLSTSAQL